MTLTTPNPAAEFTDTFNFRDLGGLGAAEGATVRHGLLFRGASLNRINDADADRLLAMGVRSVVDLRSGGEIELEGSFPEELGLNVEQSAISPTRASFEGRPDIRLAERYESLLEQGGETIRRVITLLAQPATGPLAVYCAAGKDRTGVVIAVVLALLGVDDKEIAADYHLSEAEVVRMLDWLMENYEEGSSERYIFTQPREVTLAPPQEMAYFLERARCRYGSFEGYAELVGVERETLAMMRRRLLAPAP